MTPTRTPPQDHSDAPPAPGAVIGWDIGGAHLKAARIEAGRVVAVRQAPLPLWMGLKHLEKAFDAMLPAFGPGATHRITMTGELVDLFGSRREGVAAIAAVASARLGADVRIYAGRAGFTGADAAERHADDIASANWHATATLVGECMQTALLIDMGSTTTDIIPVVGGRPAARGYSDAERMATGELVYTGAVRTPLMAVAERAPVSGRWVGVAAEYFATMADANRLLGRLDEAADQYPPADGKGKTMAESRTRLARMLGHDVDDVHEAAWVAVAAWFAEAQLRRMHDGALLALAGQGGSLGSSAPVVGCGVGRAQVEELARRLGRPYLDLGTLLPAAADVGGWPSACAPAVAVALIGNGPITAA
ncbi:hydantoinase/oxoprolinase family protein [Methylobrevis albus]|uniref:H4MPT-linked C1 transfer pathway protein n=1 Tax=Methylobrevis albus TaxID=2793297 RepID=A0A931I4X7_9HYPH|nr:hydantoinase/oxoprolinase family protein [Methylobrevis albus]MBH0239624.1 H4MPT-linked C1 transfer pathway protein [Methylobrevis albus]